MDESGQLQKAITDLSSIISSYLSEDGTRYLLHSELVSVGDTETCSQCVPCLQLMKEEEEIERPRRHHRTRRKYRCVWPLLCLPSLRKQGAWPLLVFSRLRPSPTDQ